MRIIETKTICDDDYRCDACRYPDDSYTHKGDKITALISCEYIQYGDYDNSCAVERANVRYLQENNLIEREETGGYGYVKAWLLDTEENRELLGSLENYPCFDDQIVSEIEMEMENEYLKDNGRDIHRLLKCKDIIEDLDIEFDRDAYEAAKEKHNEYFIVESGGNGYIDFRRIAPEYERLLRVKHPAINIIEELQSKVVDPEIFNPELELLHEVRSFNRQVTQEEVYQILLKIEGVSK